MPKSKREKVVHLSKTKKKGRAAKEKIINELNECLGLFNRLFVFSVENMRNESFKDVRKEFQGSRFFMGKNKVMAHAISQHHTASDKGNLQILAKYVSGNCGLLFTNSEHKEVKQYFDDFSAANFARAGFTAVKTFTLPSGALDTVEFPFSMEPQLRKLGLPTSLKNGIIELQATVTVCREGDVLTPEQCKILQLFHQQMAQFKVKLHCMYEKDSGKLSQFEALSSDASSGSLALGEDDADDMEPEDISEKKKPAAAAAPKKAAAKKKSIKGASSKAAVAEPTDFKFDPKMFAFSFDASAAPAAAATSTDSTPAAAPAAGSAASRVTRSRAKKA